MPLGATTPAGYYLLDAGILLAFSKNSLKDWMVRKKRMWRLLNDRQPLPGSHRQ